MEIEVTEATKESFRKAIVKLLEDNFKCWDRPVIYADNPKGEMRFDVCNEDQPWHSDGFIWLHVEPDSFGDLSDDHAAEADFIVESMYDDAVEEMTAEYANYDDTPEPDFDEPEEREATDYEIDRAEDEYFADRSEK